MITVKREGEHYATHAAHRLPLLLLPKMKAELNRMEREGPLDEVTRHGGVQPRCQ